MDPIEEQRWCALVETESAKGRDLMDLARSYGIHDNLQQDDTLIRKRVRAAIHTRYSEYQPLLDAIAEAEKP